MSNPTLEQFEVEIKELLAAGLKGLKAGIEDNKGVLDEKSFRALEILNKCVTEIKKRQGNEKPQLDFSKASDEELESDF